MAKRNRKISFSRSDPSLLQSRCASSSVPLRPPKNYLYAINISQKYAAVSALLATRQKNWAKKRKSHLKCRIFRNSMNLSLFMSYSVHKLFLQNFHIFIFICICITWIIICRGTFGAFNSTARDTKLWIIFWRLKCRWTAQNTSALQRNSFSVFSANLDHETDHQQKININERVDPNRIITEHALRSFLIKASGWIEVAIERKWK